MNNGIFKPMLCPFCRCIVQFDRIIGKYICTVCGWKG